MNSKLLLFSIVVVGAVAGLGVYALRKPPPIPLQRVTEPRRGAITRGVLAIGRVEPRTRVEVKSKANGILQKLHVDVSDQVRKGQVIAELDRELLQAKLVEAEGRVQQVQAQLESAKANLQRLEVEKKDPELTYAEKSWERVQQLHEGGVVSDDERDLARERYDKAEYSIRVIDAQIRIAKAAVAAAEGLIQQVQAQAELARQELKEATILSPIDGVVLYRYLEEGDAVSSIRVAGGNATIIMTLGDLSELYVDGEVDEVDVGKIIKEQQIRPDQVAKIHIESFQDRTFLGRVHRITPLGLEDSNGIVTFEVRIVLENPERLLLANMTANAVIVLEEKEDVLLLSQGAVLTEGADHFALVYDPETGRSQRQKIELGISDGSHVEVASGLETGQKVLIP